MTYSSICHLDVDETGIKLMRWKKRLNSYFPTIYTIDLNSLLSQSTGCYFEVNTIVIYYKNFSPTKKILKWHCQQLNVGGSEFPLFPTPITRRSDAPNMLALTGFIIYKEN